MCKPRMQRPDCNQNFTFDKLLLTYVTYVPYTGMSDMCDMVEMADVSDAHTLILHYIYIHTPTYIHTYM